MKKGLDKGKKEKALEIALSLIDILDVEIIAQKTGLTVQEIEALKNEVIT